MTIPRRSLTHITSAPLLALLVATVACRSDAGLGSDGGGGHNNNTERDGALSPDAAPPDATLPDPDPHLVSGLSVTRVEIYQAVQTTIFEGNVPVGHAARIAPVVGGRKAFVRVHVTPAEPGAWTAREVRAELFLGPSGVRPFDPLDPGASEALVLSDTLTMAGASDEASLGTTFGFLVPATHVKASPPAAWALRLVDPLAASPAVPPGTSHEARVPPDGLATHGLEAQDDLGGLELVLVPLRYDRDGSGRLPDTSPEQLGRIRALLANIYPVSQVSITLRDAVPWDEPLTWTGNFDFGDLNRYLVNLRVAENASARAHYYGLVCPADTFSAYCGSSCVTGQSYVVTDPENSDYRVGGGMGYSGDDSAWTLAHELGHMFGRSHAPCGVTSSDRNYPYSGGSIGVYGMDLRESPAPLLSPDTFKDLMGYCDPTWVSDYTYMAFWLRTLAVNALPPPPMPLPPLPGMAPLPWSETPDPEGQVPGPATGTPGPSVDAPGLAVDAPGLAVDRPTRLTASRAPQRYAVLRLMPGAAPRLGKSLLSRTAPLSGERAPVIFRDARGKEVSRTEAPLMRLSHGGEVQVFLPEPFPAGATAVELPEALLRAFGLPRSAARLPLPR